MIEEGLVLLVNADATVTARSSSGGFLGQLPKDQPMPTWIYSFRESEPTITFDGVDPLTRRLLLIECHANTALEAVQLADAVRRVLSGYKGTLTDADHTVVAGINHKNTVDYSPDESSRTFHRSLEFNLWFYQS